MQPKKGTRVRFITDSLGASERDELSRCVTDTWGKGEEGIAAFPHPAKKLADEGWIYVEVDSKSGEARKLYVGVSPRMFELVKVRCMDCAPTVQRDATHFIRDYFIAVQVDSLGRNTKRRYVCAEHARQWDQLHPLSAKAQAL